MTSNLLYYFCNILPGINALAARAMKILQNRHVYAAPPVRAIKRGDGRMIWLAAVLGTLGLVDALAGSSRGAAVFLAVWGITACILTDECWHLLFCTPVLWLVPGMVLASVIWSQTPQASLRAAMERGLTRGIAPLTTGLGRPRAFISAMLVNPLLGADPGKLGGGVFRDRHVLPAQPLRGRGRCTISFYCRNSPAVRHRCLWRGFCPRRGGVKPWSL
jgi:hypothetical protein